MAGTDESNDLGSLASAFEKLAAAPAEPVLRGTVIDDQYRIERVLGHGAMGVVYLARDLRLEREVAVKLAREKSPRAVARSSREALALAQLSHPNVVVIYQVGVVDDRVYVAMEYVAGATARAWCTEARSVREIVALYAAVGDGLAAAHAAGLVHRDFKPDNVLVGDDGRARVADFGLARAPDAADEAVGTPAYMAPEQIRGEVVDHRADQFAFCSSLWEALAGARFGDEPRRRIPRHVEVALRRGLAPERAARWPSLAPLLAELRRDPARKRRLVALAAAVPAIVAVAVVTTRAAQPAASDACDGGPARMAQLWAPERARAAMAPAGAPAWVASEAASVVARLDGWTARWATQYRAVCEAAAWTPALRADGAACLARAEHALEATLESVTEPGVDASKLDAIVDELPRPEPCVDPSYLAAIVPPPTDPVLAQQVATAQQQLARARALATAGKMPRAVEQIKQIAKPALEHPPLRAEVHLVTALLDRWRGDDAKAFTALRDAYYEGRTVGERFVATEAASEGALALLNLSRDAEAGEWAHLAEVEVASIADPDLQAKTFRALTIVATDRSELDRALELSDRALKIARRVDNKFGLQSTLQARSAVNDHLGKYDAALADLEEAAKIVRASSGDKTPALSAIGAAESIVYIHLGRFDDAIAAARGALAIAEAIGGPESDIVSVAVGALGTALAHGGKLPEALALQDRSLAIDRKSAGERSYNVASDLNNRCELLTQLTRYADAIADCRTAIEIWRESLAADANEIGAAELNLADALTGVAKYAEARDASGRASAILGKQPDNPAQGLALVAHAASQRQLHELAGARADLEHAIAILTHGAGNPGWLAGARLELARLELAAGKATHARELATQARDTFAANHDHRLAEAEQLVGELEHK